MLVGKMHRELCVAFDFLYEELSPFMVVGLSAAYFVGRGQPVVPYVLVAGWPFVGAVLAVRAVREARRRGWLRWICEVANYYIGKAWIRALLGLRYMRDSWLGRVLALFAVANIGLLAPWVYYNVDPLRWMRASVQLIVDVAQYITDPPALLVAFDVWKDSVPLLGPMLRYGAFYTANMVQMSKNGDHGVLLAVPIMSFLLGGAAVVAYLLWNFGNVYRWLDGGHWQQWRRRMTAASRGSQF